APRSRTSYPLTLVASCAAMTYRYFYDCEFIEDGRTVDLVSIGVVDEHGREFYAVSTEFDGSRAVPWVRRNVLDKLPSPADPAWRARERLREDLVAFLVEPVRGRPGEELGLGAAGRPELPAWTWRTSRNAYRCADRRRGLPRPERGDPGGRPQGRHHLRSRVCRLPGRLAGSAGRGDPTAGHRRGAGDPAARRHHPRLLTDQPVQD